jgi:hypothetical protein
MTKLTVNLSTGHSDLAPLETSDESTIADMVQAQIAAEAVKSNRRTVEAAVAEALAQNRTIITGADTYLDGHITLPTSPTTAQTVAAVKAYGQQVRALTVAAQWAAQQRQGIIRLVINKLDDGTD